MPLDLPGPYRVRPGHPPELHVPRPLPPHIEYRGEKEPTAVGRPPRANLSSGLGGRAPTAAYIARAHRAAAMSGDWTAQELAAHPGEDRTPQAVRHWCAMALGRGHIRRVAPSLFRWVGDLRDLEVTRAA